MSAERKGRNIVIIGGGIIGCCTAYYASHHEKFNRETDTITLLEATTIAGGASGKAGGLLALWAYPACIVPLSYRLHQELAEKYGGAERWGYRTLNCGQIDMDGVLADEKTSSVADGKSLPLGKRGQKAKSLLRAAGIPKDLDWIAAEGIKSYEEMGTPLTTAQVHPYQFTTSMAQLAQDRGVNIIYGSATSINQSSSSVISVTYIPCQPSSPIPQTLPADTVILTTGPWTPTLLPKAPISSLRAHSITIRPSTPLTPYALFTSISLQTAHASESVVTPEIYTRPNNEVYVCGDTDSLVPLPPTSALVQTSPSHCAGLFARVSTISRALRDGEVTARQACYLPYVEGKREGPIVGETSGVKGLLVGVGHSCWGVQNGPGTGRCLGEIVWEGRVGCAEITNFLFDVFRRTNMIFGQVDDTTQTAYDIVSLRKSPNNQKLTSTYETPMLPCGAS
ncbi:FAD dependent oxidoreductase [Phaeosphaeriaceae sp. PMI808]|nr:FAD dependent oxidoreductase [Phaeosphaeriaceae sp. PMI808]